MAELTRKELYEMVWQMPFQDISAKYLVTEVALRRTCIEMSVPLPRAGHWEKEPSKRTQPVPLSTNYKGKKMITLRSRAGFPQDDPQKEIYPQNEDTPGTNNSRSLVPKKLANPDKLIVEAMSALDKKESNGIYRGVVDGHGAVLDIHVSLKNQPRAFRFMDSLLKIFRGKGYDIQTHNRKTYVVINGGKIRFAYHERLKRTVVQNDYRSYTRTEMQSTGMVFFKIEASLYNREWKDGDQTLEQQLPAILEKIEDRARLMSEERAINRKFWADHEEKERIQKEAEARKQKDAADFRALLSEAARWKEAQILREYLAHLEQTRRADGSLTNEFHDWLTWARLKLESWDPLSGSSVILFEKLI